MSATDRVLGIFVSIHLCNRAVLITYLQFKKYNGFLVSFQSHTMIRTVEQFELIFIFSVKTALLMMCYHSGLQPISFMHH